MARTTRHARAAAIFACGACVFLLLIGRQDVAITHEARVAQTAREMAASGWPWRAALVEVPAAHLVVEGGRKSLRADPSAPPLRVNPWVVPVLTGEIRLQKPPLPYWCAAVLFRLFGEGAGTARFVPALLGAAAALVLYDLARRLIGRRAAPVAELLWVSSYFVVSEFRKAMADPYLAFFTLGCVWAWVRASMSPRTTWIFHAPREPSGSAAGPTVIPSETVPDRRTGSSAGWIVLFYASLALALLAKGPVVLVHVSLAAVAYHACYRRPVPLHPLGHAVGALLLLAVALPWPLAVWRSVPHALELWRYESVGELADNRRNAAPFWAYLPKLPYLALPWTPLWAAALIYPFYRSRDSAGATEKSSQKPRRRRRRLFFALAWYGATVVFFSFVNLKKDAYLLPVMPAQTLLVAQFVHAAIVWARLRGVPKWLDTLAWVQTTVGAALALVLVGLLIAQMKRPPAGTGLPFAAIASIAAALTIAAAVPPVRGRIRARRSPGRALWPERWFAAEAVACAVAVSVFVAVYNAARENRRSPRPFAETVWRLVSDGGPAPAPGRALYRAGLPPTVAFYLPLDTGREDAARTVIVVGGKSARAADVSANYAAETGQTVAEARAVPLDDRSNPDRWTLFELTLANPRRFASSG
jgi:4-amino-4-deoxy-L-arabinose transferase-like glycosyltransferase